MTSIADTTRLLKQVRKADAVLYHHDDRVFLNQAAPAELHRALEQLHAQVINLVVPRVTNEQRRQVKNLLDGYQVHFITDDNTAAEAVMAALCDAREYGCLALDTETAVLPEYRQPIPIALTQQGTVAKRQPKDGAAGYALIPRKARVRLVQVHAGSDNVWLFDMHAVSWTTLVPLLTEPPVLALHNATFDVKMILASGGNEPTVRVWDTMVAMRLVDGTRPSMANAAAALLDIELPKTLGASDWGGALSQDQLDYAALDSVITWQLWNEQQQIFDETDLNAQQIVDEAIVAVARMELTGLPIDVVKHQQLIDQWQQETRQAIRAIRKFITGGTGLPTNAEVADYLANTLDAEVLDDWPTTPKDTALSVSRKVLAARQDEIPGVHELLVAREWSKALSTYGPSLLAKVEDGRLYGSFLIAGARSGRASSKDPNVQNMPKRSRKLAEFRTIFKAPAGRVLIAADYSQIELRAMAAVTGDETMTELYRDFGRVYRDKEAAAQYDLHSLTASSFSQHETPTKEDRSIAKAINFSLAYGAGPKGVQGYAESAFGLRMSLHEAAEKMEAFYDRYPGVADWQFEQEQTTRRDGFVSTVGGRRWFWEWRAKEYGDPRMDELDDWQVDDWLTGYERNYALNHPIQGTCAEIMWVALHYIDKALRPYDARLVAVVHDEVVIECADDPQTEKAVRRILLTKMTRAWLEFFPEAPWRGLVDVGVAKTWADAH